MTLKTVVKANDEPQCDTTDSRVHPSPLPPDSVSTTVATGRSLRTGGM